MNHEPTVTALSVYYNRAFCVKDSVQSLLEQSYPHLSILLVDDGSTDGTLAALREFESDPRVRVLGKSNTGLTSTLRSTIENHVQTDLVAIHGSGDISLPERITRQVEALVAHPNWEAAGCWVDNLTEKGERLVFHRRREPFGTKELLWHNYYSHGEVIFRRKTYLEVGGYRTAFPMAQDRDMWLRLLHRGGVGGVVPEMLYLRSIRSDGVQGNPMRKAVQEMLSLSARKNYLLRRECGFDAVDRAGDAGVHLVNGSRYSALILRNRARKLDRVDPKSAKFLRLLAAVVLYGDSPRLFELYLKNHWARRGMDFIDKVARRSRESLYESMLASRKGTGEGGE